MLEPLRKDAQGQYFRSSHGFIGRGAVRQHTRKLRNLGQPSAILLALTFNVEVHDPPLYVNWTFYAHAPEGTPNE